MAGVTHLLGHTVGRYHIESVIGTGGFATVYRAVDTALERPVALKVVDPSAHRSPTIARRFILEGRAVASLNHPAVVPVYDTGEQDGVLWLAMRLIEGRSLDDAVVAGRRLRPEETFALIERIGAALDHAHAHGIVHRDVKPSNILLEDDDPAKAWLTDFGIAATARTAGLYTTGVIGTAAYMAPEQSRPSEVGPPADLYSLACVVYELVNGRRVFEGDDYVGLLLAHATAPVAPIGHAGLDALFARALAKTPEARPGSGAEFARELKACLADFAPEGPTHMELTRAGLFDETVVEQRDRTLVYPAAPPAPTTPAAPPQPRPAPPQPQPQPGYRPPPPPPQPQPPRDPTVVRNSRRGARRSFAAGIAVLLLGAGAGVLAYLEVRGDDWVTVPDEAGVEYDVVSGWDSDVQAPTVTWTDDGNQVLEVTHRPLDEPDAVDAAAVLADQDPALCLGDDPALAVMNIPGADGAALCNNGSDEPARVVAAIVDGELWLFQLRSSLTEGERDRITSSIDFS